MKTAILTSLCVAVLAACGGGTDEAEFSAAAQAAVETSAPSGGGSVPSPPGASQIVFSGITFNVRSGTGGPGPNAWSAQNVWVDGSGYLHLKIANNTGQWSTAEIYTDQAFGFGTYQYKIVGHPEALDKNVVLGLFDYPTPDVGPDGTNEIDIEFATWGGAQAEHGNFTVWPALAGNSPATHAFDATPNTGLSTHRFNWTSKQVAFQSMAGLTNKTRGMYANWTYAPADYLTLIPQSPTPLHINLWLFQGNPPSDGLETEIVISEFTFTPARKTRR
jgi:hypothetical protein